MRPVTGGDRKDERQSEQANNKLTKQDADKAGKVRRDSDSSEETQSNGDSGKGSKSSLKLKTKQWPKERPVSVAPHSTTKANAADTFSSSKPIIRVSQKRDDYQSAVVRDKMLGEKGPYRRRETDLQLDYPELKTLQLAKFKRELIQRSNSAGGYLEVEVKDKKTSIY